MPVGHGSEIVLHFNHLKIYFSPCPEPSSTQEDEYNEFSKAAAGVCRPDCNRQECFRYSQGQQSLLSDCATSFPWPAENRAEQEATGPSQGPHPKAMGGNPLKGKKVSSQQKFTVEVVAIVYPWSNIMGRTHPCQKGKIVNLTLHKEGALCVKEGEPVWSGDYEMSC